jgi:hypothetical protein
MSQHPHANEPTDSLLGVGDIFLALRAAVFTGALLAIPFALGNNGDYGTPAVLIGVVSFFLWLLAIALLTAGRSTSHAPERTASSGPWPAVDGESAATFLGRILAGILMVALFLGIAIYVVLRIEVSNSRPATPPSLYRAPVTPTFKR